jgi:Cdc6-like AAA superfamily ATPase
MKRSRHSVLLNAFRPAKEMDDPGFFAGRADQVKRLTDSLHIPGSCPIIYGNRGLGKTSLALQTMYVAMGNNALLNTLGLEDRALDADSQFLAFFVTCTDSTKNFNGLTQLLINTAEEADFTEEGKGNKAGRLTSRTVSRKISLKAFEAESIKTYEREKGRQSYKLLSLGEKLQELIRILNNSYDVPVLFIIDEVDRLAGTQGLGSFIKAASGEYAKFILVGIASNVDRLLSDHRSLERSLVPVHVPPMTEDELYQITEKAEEYLAEQAVEIRFDRSAKLKLVEVASGYPWFVHVLGQSALMLTAEAKRDLVVDSDVLQAIDTINRNQFAQQFSDSYLFVVRNSHQRETALRTFAEWRDTDIPTGEIYRVLKTRLGVSDPSAYKGQLASREYGRIIVTPQHRNPTWVRFDNEMFKIYVRLRRSIYPDVDKNVREASRNWPRQTSLAETT